MTEYQSNSAVVVAQKVQSGLGVQATGSGASVLRTAGGAGIKLTKAATESNEVRSDGMRARGRHGTQKSSSAYAAELSLGSHDAILEAIVRGTWGAVTLTATEADMTSVTIGANSIVAAAGNWITKGFRAGDVVRAANLADAANNGRNLRLVNVTDDTLTTAETLTVNSTPDTSFTITRPGKRLINPTSLIKRYFTLEEYEVDIDQSTVLTDFVWSSIKFSMSANGLITADPGGMGTGKIDALSAGSSPLFTNPLATTAPPMSVVDATIRYNGADLVSLSSFDLTVDIGASAPDVFGSGAIKYAPAVFSGQMAVSFNMTMLRKDLSDLQAFINEDQLSLHVLAVDNESEPKDFMSIVVPNFTLGGVDPSAMSKQGGGRTQTISVPAALVGVDNRGAGFDPTMIKFQTTAA